MPTTGDSEGKKKPFDNSVRKKVNILIIFHDIPSLVSLSPTVLFMKLAMGWKVFVSISGFFFHFLTLLPYAHCRNVSIELIRI